MASYNGSTEQLEFKGEVDAPKKRLHIVLGLCAFFAVLSLIFIILYATAAKNTAEPVGGKTGDINTFILTRAFKKLRIRANTELILSNIQFDRISYEPCNILQLYWWAFMRYFLQPLPCLITARALSENMVFYKRPLMRNSEIAKINELRIGKIQFKYA